MYAIMMKKKFIAGMYIIDACKKIDTIDYTFWIFFAWTKYMSYNIYIKPFKSSVVRKLPRATTNVQKNKSYVGLFISYVGLFISYVGLIKSYVGLYNSYVGDKIS